MSSRVRASCPWYTCMLTHPARLLVASGCPEATQFMWHFVLWYNALAFVAIASRVAVCCTASRGPSWLLPFPYMSSWLRLCFMGALQSCGSADGGQRERSERWSWRHTAPIIACALRGLPWSVLAAIFCVRELMASSLLRGRFAELWFS